MKGGTEPQKPQTQPSRQLSTKAGQVQIIDDDLGKSGTSAEGRAGFQRLVSEVSLDHVGIILGVEMSRLARSNADWHRLLELCALFGTLLADLDGVYDPAQYNDRLLLGLKRPVAYSTPYSTLRSGLGRPSRRHQWYRLPSGRLGVFGAPLPAVAAADVADVEAGEGAAEGGAPAARGELPGDLAVGGAWGQIPNQGKRRGRGLQGALPGAWSVHLDGGEGAGAPVDLEHDGARVRHAVEVHGRDGEAQELLALPVGRRVGVPD